MPDKMSPEKIACCAPTAPRWSSARPPSRATSPQSLLLRRRPPGPRDPGAFQPNQYFNPRQPRGPLPDHRPGDLAADRRPDRRTSSPASGTGGTITGVGRYLKEQNPAVQIVGADPEGSIYSRRASPALQGRGHRRGLLPGHVRPSTWSTEFIQVTDRESFVAARQLAREEGILVGGSAGAGARTRRSRWPWSSTAGRRDRGAAARHRPQLPEQVLQRRVDAPERLPRAARPGPRARGHRLAHPDGVPGARQRRRAASRSARRSTSCSSTASRSCR